MRRVARRRRGAAMVEAVVAIPFFILIFVSILYVGKLYAQKQRTLREAKQEVWTYALNNCEGSVGNVSQSSGGGVTPMGGLNSKGVGITGKGAKYVNDSGGGGLTKDSGTAKATVKATVVADNLLGGFSNKLSTTTRMQCNEKPAQDSILGVLKAGWHDFTSW